MGGNDNKGKIGGGWLIIGAKGHGCLLWRSHMFSIEGAFDGLVSMLFEHTSECLDMLSSFEDDDGFMAVQRVGESCEGLLCRQDGECFLFLGEALLEVSRHSAERGDTGDDIDGARMAKTFHEICEAAIEERVAKGEIGHVMALTKMAFQA